MWRYNLEKGEKERERESSRIIRMRRVIFVFERKKETNKTKNI